MLKFSKDTSNSFFKNNLEQFKHSFFAKIDLGQ